MSKAYELIVFDWDGTLMDSAARIVTCIQRAAVDAGAAVPTPEEARDIIGLGLNEAIERLFPDTEKSTTDAIVQAYRHHWLGNEIEDEVMFEGAYRLVEHLYKNDILLAVATGKSRRGLDKALGDSGLGAFFHMTRCADETRSKPHPQMLTEILTDLNTPAAKAVVIGDTEYDMQMAVNAGVDAIGIAHGVHSLDRLLGSGAQQCFSDLIELTAWLSDSLVPRMEV